MEKGLAAQYGDNTPWYQQYEASREQKWEPTRLAPEEAPEFENWMTKSELYQNIKNQVAAENKIPVDKIDDKRLINGMMSQGEYDYVGAWKDNVGSEVSQHDGQPHMPSRDSKGRMLKSPNHPTTWKEYFMGAYGYDPDDMGAHTYEEARKYQGPVNR